MIAEVTEHLVAALVAAGVPQAHVHRGAAALAQSKVKPRAVVHWLRTDETLRRDGSLVAILSADGTRRYRRRLYRRELEACVQVDATTHAEADALLMGTIRRLGRGLEDAGGNWIAVGDAHVGRVEEKSQAAQTDTAVAAITFIGGLYEETPANIATGIAPEGAFVEEL